ncbi:metal-dependent hydrolase [Stieleria sp. TO1_6]|uniref:metal-dependent hydrolase n=1 Tax=Stieleria tagensis TaxID=2956795 RepID=UPI00209BB360|nr:metal-dependent hydrolase [Stieleria tagensis]MCO8120538.1 metal-dependent hydrolase [Stieleria tagensis]
MTQLTWLSHASWLIETDSQRILLDPFFAENPAAKVSADDFADATHVLVSHGHFDHVADVAAVIEKSGAQLITSFEIAQWFASKHGVADPLGMNIGGTHQMGETTVKMVPAIHSSSLPDGSYAGTAAGFVLTIAGRRLYFACDTAYFSDMKFYADGVDVAVLPIGDLFTMGIDDSIAAIKQITPQVVLPTHYGTWPPIEQDAAAWADKVRAETSAKPIVLTVGESYPL